MKYTIFPISLALIQACPSLTPYEKDLLTMRHPERKKVQEIAQHYGKSKGTVSPQISRALKKFESWCGSNEKQVSKIEEEDRLKTEDVQPDDELKGLETAFDEIHKRKVLGGRKLDLKLKLEEESAREQEIKVRNDPRTFAGYARRIFPTQFREMSDLVGKRKAKRVLVKALREFTLFEEWRLQHGVSKFDDYAKQVIEQLVKGEKRERLLERFSTNVPTIFVCPRCKEVDVEVQVECHQSHLDQFMCPRCKGRWVWGCPVCDELEIGKSVKMNYSIDNYEITCTICGHHRPIYPLEEQGTVAARRSRIMEETREELGSPDAAKYADSVVFPRKYI